MGRTHATIHRAPPGRAFGVLYQHGRPTPFSGQGIEETQAYTAIYNGAATKLSSGSIGGYTQSNTAVSSVTDAIKTPNTYCYNSSNGAWFSVDISLWNDYGTNKSIYDPCPYGYRVPKSGDGTASSWYGFTKSTWTANVIDGGALWSSTWWPAAGLRFSNSGTIGTVGNTGYYWSSSRHSYAYYSYRLYFDCNGGVYPSDYYSRSCALTVRCVQERGALRVGPGTWDLGALVCCSLLGSLDYARNDTEGRRVMRLVVRLENFHARAWDRKLSSLGRRAGPKR